MKRGLALVVVIGILGVLAALATAFVLMAQLERRASAQRVHAARAYLLARSGIEDGLARLEAGQDPAYGGEDWDNDGTLSAYEAAQEAYQRGVPNTANCPVRHAMRPSFFIRMTSGNPVTIPVEARERGLSGELPGDHAARGNTYALRMEGLGGRIWVNGGALDGQDRDPDGPGAPPEASPLAPNGIPDHRDVSMEGPNGFLVRLLDNLEAVATGAQAPSLGSDLVGARPPGGYRSLDDLGPVLGPARLARLRPFLAVLGQADPQVVKPQPVDGRPQRFLDIDDAHRIGTEAAEIAGVHHDETAYVYDRFGRDPEDNQWKTVSFTGVGLSLQPGNTGYGSEGNPWTQWIKATNSLEGTRTYPVRWERDFLYAWQQLRLAPPALEPRQPIVLGEASLETLAAVLAGLKGSRLEVWEGSGGWDGAFGFWQGGATYPYPDRATEETPWHRTRADYGMTYLTGQSVSSPPASSLRQQEVSTLPGPRPWYGPQNYNPHGPPTGYMYSYIDPGPPPVQKLGTFHPGGTSLVQAAPLGRLKETAPISREQALEAAAQLLQAGPIRTWTRFNEVVDRLPGREDLDGDGLLDGAPYRVTGDAGAYTRRIYRREDLDSDGVMDDQAFPGGAKGLTFPQKDVIKAMANPNTDLNDFNPDANLWKEVDKTDLAGIAPGSYAHTTELALDGTGPLAALHALGRVADSRGRLLARRQLSALLRLSQGTRRDSTQGDFMKAYNPGDPLPLPVGAVFSPAYLPPLASPAPYPLSGGQALVGYPEPQTLAGGLRAADAGYDGQIGLGFIAPEPGTGTETLRGALFDTPDALDSLPPDLAFADLRGPYHLRLVGAAAEATGNVFPDGVYSEKDRALKFLMQDNLLSGTVLSACWMKPNWFPEATPRPHALVSLSTAGVEPGFPGVPRGRVPIDDIRAFPMGLYFVPGRNNAWQGAMGHYSHGAGTTRGQGWPCHALLWGAPHSLWASDNLNRRGTETPQARLLGRLEAHRWQHVAMMGDGSSSRLILGRTYASEDPDGGGWNKGQGAPPAFLLLLASHSDKTLNHLRFGEISGENNMNYAADATFANVRAGKSTNGAFYLGANSPAARGRYYKEPSAAYTSPSLPAGIRPLRATWTEIPCDLWFDETGPNGTPDGWAELLANDRFGAGGAPGPNGLRDVHIELEIWGDRGTPGLTGDDLRLARFSDPAGPNRIPTPPPAAIPLLQPRLYYKAVFVNEWDEATRQNHPLDVTPFLDDVTIAFASPGGPVVLAWEDTPAD